MTIPHYIHSDLSVYLSAFPEIAENATSPAEIVTAACARMMEDLEEITDGKLVVPAFNYRFPETKIFDVRNDQSEVGQFSEYFRNKFGDSRSYIPIFSHCVNFDDFLSNEVENEIDPFSDKSDFAALVNNKGKIVTFGSPFAPSFIIYVERQIVGGPLYRYNKDFFGEIILPNGFQYPIKLLSLVRPRQIDISYNLPKVKSELLKEGILTQHQLRKRFPYTICDAETFLVYALDKLKIDPLYFLTEETKKLLAESGTLKRGRVSFDDFE
jgi:aminoglycoside 3-N-acetyltransferase